MPGVYHEYVLRESTTAATPADDSHCLATLKHFRSLVPMAQEARKPIFKLTPADGAIGSHAQAVAEAFNDFKRLAETLLERMKKLESTLVTLFLSERWRKRKEENSEDNDSMNLPTEKEEETG